MATKKTKATKTKVVKSWSHKKHGKGFKGSYAKGSDGKRNIYLTKKVGDKAPKAFEFSHPAKAIKAGWLFA